MKQLFKLNVRNIVLLAGLVLVLFIAGCLTLDSVDIPTDGVVNQTSVFTIHCGISSNGDEDTKLIIGLLVPKNWNAASNASLTYTSPYGSGALSVLPAGITEITTKTDWIEALRGKYGIGDNLLDEMEWVVFQSDKSYTVKNGDNNTFSVEASIKLGSENMLVKLGYFAGTLKEGFNNGINGVPFYGSFFQSGNAHFTVTGGTGEIVDYINPQLNTSIPSSALDNDVITFTYDNLVAATGLLNISDIYLCAIATTTAGEEISVCEQTAKTKLTAIGGQKYRFDLWPRGFFNLPAGKSLASISFYYTDVTGTIKVGYGNTADPFKYTFKCAN